MIIDDEIDTAGSLMEAVGALQAEGATRSTRARRTACSLPTRSIASRTARSPRSSSPTPSAPPGADDPRLTVLSVAPLFGEAIKRIHRGESVGALFSSEVRLVEEMTFWDEAAEDDDDELDAARTEPFPVSARG